MIVVRTATTDDLDAVLALGKIVNDHHHRHAPDIFAAPADALRDIGHWRAAITAAHGTCLLAIDDAPEPVPLGFVTATLHAPTHTLMAPSPHVRVDSLGVAPEARGRGIGRMLMDAAERWARERGAVDLRLSVFDFNVEAIALYRSLGFEARAMSMGKALERMP